MIRDREELQTVRSLELAVTYRREIGAGVERIWENVFDWEHLPVLHQSYFIAVELLEMGDWGWRVALTKNPGTADRRIRLTRVRLCGLVTPRSRITVPYRSA